MRDARETAGIQPRPDLQLFLEALPGLLPSHPHRTLTLTRVPGPGTLLKPPPYQRPPLHSASTDGAHGPNGASRAWSLE
eukprot:9471890-Pyramimonas_sp.AAC.2